MKDLSPKQMQQAVRAIDQAMRTNYPFTPSHSLAGWRKHIALFDRSLTSSLPAEDFFDALEIFLASWNDAHTKLNRIPGRRWFGPKQLSIHKIGKDFILFQKNRPIGPISSIDDKNIFTALRQQEKRIAASTSWYRKQQAMQYLLLSTQPRIGTRLVVRNHTPRMELFARRPHIGPWQANPPTIVIKEKKAYVRIPRWSSDDATKIHLDNIIHVLAKKNPLHITIDVRENGGGNGNVAREFAAHFFKLATPFGTTKRRIPGKKIRWNIHRHILEPAAPYISAPITLLIGAECLSSNEYFIAGLRDNKRAVTEGQTTGGSSGNPLSVPIVVGPHECVMQISTWRYTRPNGSPLEGRGILPDIKRDYSYPFVRP